MQALAGGLPVQPHTSTWLVSSLLNVFKLPNNELQGEHLHELVSKRIGYTTN